MSKVADFVKRMEKQGRQFEVNGNFVVISPTNGLEMSDLIEMQNINKKANLRIIFPCIARGRQMSNRFTCFAREKLWGATPRFIAITETDTAPISTARTFIRRKRRRDAGTTGERLTSRFALMLLMPSAVWHVDCQYIPCDSVVEQGCSAYVAYKKVTGTGTMFTGYKAEGCQPMISARHSFCIRQHG